MSSKKIYISPLPKCSTLNRSRGNASYNRFLVNDWESGKYLLTENPIHRTTDSHDGT